MATAFIGLGSNLGAGIEILQGAWKRIGEHEGITLCALSHPYLTAPVGMQSSNWFTNAVGKLNTTLSPAELLEYLLQVESVFGRTRNTSTPGYQDRSLDLDILCYNGAVLQAPDLILPHPRLAERLFVLAPFAEIAPEYKTQPGGPTLSERCSHLIEGMRTGQIPRQEIKKTEWEE